MIRIWSFLVVLVLSPTAIADYYKFYTQVQVNPAIGNIVISRGIVREEKYVEYMISHKEEMTKDNIFSDASHGLVVEEKVLAERDGQNIEVIVRSDHRRMHGPGCAIADNYIEIRVDGNKIFESTFGDYRIQSEVNKIILMPLKSTIFVYGHDSATDKNDYHEPDAFWYDELEDGEYIYLLEPGTYWKHKELESVAQPPVLTDSSVPCQDLCCNPELIAVYLRKLEEEKGKGGEPKVQSPILTGG